MENKKEQSQAAFDRQASRYDTTCYSRHPRALYPRLLGQIEKLQPADVLDLGCGTGALLAEIARCCPTARLSGLDLSAAMLTVAEKQLQDKAELIQGDSEALPYADCAFDLIVCCDSFHHYPNPEATARQLHRCLKPGGRLLIGDTTMPPLLRQLMNFTFRFSSEGDVRLYSQKEMRALLSEYFQDVQWQRISPSSYILQGTVRK